MAYVDFERKKDGWYWTAPDGKTGGPYDTKTEAFDAGYDYQVALENKPTKKEAAKGDG